MALYYTLWNENPASKQDTRCEGPSTGKGGIR